MHERTVSRRVLFGGRIVRLELLGVRLADGRRSEREIVRHAPAVGVVARLPDDSFLFVRQYRKALGAEVVEICAGLVEPGERPAAAARRELAEETGRRAARWTRLGRLYSSPGFTDEYAEVFLAEGLGPAGRAANDADERVEVLRWPRERVERAIAAGRIRDGKTVGAWTLLRLHEERRRAGRARRREA